MSKTKKLTLSLLSAIFLCFGIAACGPSDEPADSPQGEQNGGTTAPEDNQGGNTNPGGNGEQKPDDGNGNEEQKPEDNQGGNGGTQKPDDGNGNEEQKPEDNQGGNTNPGGNGGTTTPDDGQGGSSKSEVTEAEWDAAFYAAAYNYTFGITMTAGDQKAYTLMKVGGYNMEIESIYPESEVFHEIFEYDSDLKPYGYGGDYKDVHFRVGGYAEYAEQQDIWIKKSGINSWESFYVYPVIMRWELMIGMFGGCYDSFAYADGKYTCDSLGVTDAILKMGGIGNYDDEEFLVLKNIAVTFSNGVLTGITSEMQADSSDLPPDAEITVEFKDFGTTTVEIPTDFVEEIGRLSAEDGTFEFTFDLENSCYSLTKWSGSATAVKIPAEFNGKPVTSIGSSAFSDCSNLTSIEIPESVTSIGRYAFSDCSGLESITVAEGNTVYKSEENCIIEKATNTLVLGCKNSKIPDSVTSIGDYAFYGCSNLTSVTIGNGVTSIGERAFYNCGNLTSVTIGNGVTSIGAYAFSDCSNLTSVQWNAENCTLANSSSPFGGCTQLSTVTFGESVQTIPAYAFRGCSGLTNIEIPDSVKSIGDNAFYGCSNLTSVTIGNGVTSIGAYAFSDCSNLTSVQWNAENCTLANSSSPFGGCTQLSTVTFGESVQTIPAYAFDGCSGLTSIIIPDGVTSIGYDAFWGCSKLTSVTFKNADGWKVSKDSDMSDAQTVEVNDPEQAAKYLKNTYCSYYWKRGE